jgi:hypothetical protein
VVVNACTDDTAAVAAAHGAEVFTSYGADKGLAMSVGAWVTQTERVLFCDADLKGLTPTHVDAMLTARPLAGQLCGLTDTPAVGLTKLLPPITGQRRLPTKFARSLSLSGSGYGAELRIDAKVGRAGLPHRTVILRGVTNPTRAVRDPWRFLQMAATVTIETGYLFPDLLAYERGGLG